MKDVMCDVCLSDITTSEKARLIPGCKHQFHEEWIEKAPPTCPTCRREISDTIRVSRFIPVEGDTNVVLRIQNAAIMQTYERTVRFLPEQTGITALELRALTSIILPPDLRNLTITIRTLVDSCLQCDNNIVNYTLESNSVSQTARFCPTCKIKNEIFPQALQARSGTSQEEPPQSSERQL